MAWTNPETFTAGQTLTAASMNAISGNLTALNEGRPSAVTPMVRCRYSSGTTLNNGNLITIGWNGADDFDTDSMHDPATNNDRITINTAGVYLVVFNLYATAPFSNTVEQVIQLDGTTRVADSFIDAGAGLSHGFSQSQILSLTAGQYVKAQVFHTTGANRSPATTPPCSFSATWLGPPPA